MTDTGTQEPQVDVAALQAKLAEMEAREQARTVDDARKAAIAKYNLPEKLHRFVVGTNEQEFEETAAAAAEAFAAQPPAAPPDPAYAAYGPASGTQGAPVSRGAGDEKAERVQATNRKIRNDDPLTKREAQTFVRDVGNHAMGQLLKARHAGQGR